MTDRASAIDPLVAQGPLAPVQVLRPAPSSQRVVMLDTAPPKMVDLEVGNVRPYENGPPASLPMTSTRFDLAALQRVQIQVLRDPRTSSIDSFLFSLHLRDADTLIDVVETPAGRLMLRSSGVPEVSAPIGGSAAIVIVVELTAIDDQHRVTVSARNAETLDAFSIAVDVTATSNSLITVGGPTTDAAATRGRHRQSPVQIHTVTALEPVDQVRRVVGRARQVAGSVKRRIS